MAKLAPRWNVAFFALDGGSSGRPSSWAALDMIVVMQCRQASQSQLDQEEYVIELTADQQQAAHRSNNE
jgi:hypothetical protein